MYNESIATAKQAGSESVRSAQVDGWKFQLLPRMPYEASYTPEHSIIGFSFDSQAGTHSFASDRKQKFQAIPNGLAWVPAGCDVYSQSSGGEYLKISCSHVHYKVNRKEQRFSDVISPVAISSAFSLRRALLSMNSIDHLACEEWLMSMESTVFSVLSGKEKRHSRHGWMSKQRLRKIDEAIESRLDSQLTISELAREFGVSAGFFSRAFKTAVGRTPHQYIIDKRLATARLQLYRTEEDLTSIAFTCGFSSHSHMTAHFRERLGITPTQLHRKK